MQIYDYFNDNSAESTFDSSDIQNNKIICMIGYLIPILFFLPIVVNSQSNYCRFHSNQQLAWLIVCVVLGVLEAILGIIPILGWIINMLLGIAILAVAILLMVAAYNGKAVRIPFIGEFINVF